MSALRTLPARAFQAAAPGRGGVRRGNISIALRQVLMNSDLKIIIIFEFSAFKFMGIHPQNIDFWQLPIFGPP